MFLPHPTSYKLAPIFQNWICLTLEPNHDLWPNPTPWYPHQFSLLLHSSHKKYFSTLPQVWTCKQQELTRRFYQLTTYFLCYLSITCFWYAVMTLWMKLTYFGPNTFAHSKFSIFLNVFSQKLKHFSYLFIPPFLWKRGEFLGCFNYLGLSYTLFKVQCSFIIIE